LRSGSLPHFFFLCGAVDPTQGLRYVKKCSAMSYIPSCYFSEIETDHRNKKFLTENNWESKQRKGRLTVIVNRIRKAGL
jgi:hypothetical protein